MILEKRQATDTGRAVPRSGRSQASASCRSSTRPMERKQGTTIDSIQYLRAIAAWLVVAYHLSASLESQLGWEHSFAIGAIGVDIFFVISGYIMAMIASRTVRFSATEFLLRRFVRIAPLYWMVTIIFCLLCFLVPAAVNNPDVTLSRLVSSLLFIPDVMTGTPSPILIIGWTLNYEFFFYAIVAGSVWFTGDRTLLTAALMLCGCVIMGLLLDGNSIFEFYTQPIVMEFVLGILIWNYGSVATDHRWFVPVWCVCLPVIICTLVVSGIYDDNARFLIWGFLQPS
ncbi:acyltransferase [Rhizobium sp. 32-5/1]|uniref:acyltransferase family protein n=1 Tax=Rhizobium sp. 32-5/1 TaxID=3019602 RepID=UPI00240D4CD3|nr:acyltransferase [Rhizobium sp. 32-5/1]WEZ83819.1 acyltransferase [Rhizobium sp. 32-5/1]